MWNSPKAIGQDAQLPPNKQRADVRIPLLQRLCLECYSKPHVSEKKNNARAASNVSW